MRVFALAMVLDFAGAAQSQVICSKTNNKGKTRFKLRGVWKSNEVVSQDFAGFAPSDVVTTADLPAAPGQLANLADIPVIPAVRQTEVHNTVYGRQPERERRPAAPGGSNSQYGMASITMVVEGMAAGTHNIQVNAGLGLGAGTWWIGDLSLVVITHED